eukprot:6205150-Pleurochrysis_carterae.AAC.1
MRLSGVVARVGVVACVGAEGYTARASVCWIARVSIVLGARRQALALRPKGLVVRWAACTCARQLRVLHYTAS